MVTLKSEHFGTMPADTEGQYIADRDLYLDAKGNVVEKGDPATESKLIGKGGALSNADAKKYGLIGNDKKAKAAEAEPAVETEEAAAEAEVDGGEKASSPSANKRAKGPAKNKGAKKK